MSKSGVSKTARPLAKGKTAGATKTARTTEPRAARHVDPQRFDSKRLDLERYVPAFVTFIANKLSRSATALYQQRFGVNVTEWRIMSLLAIEPGISAARICHVIGFDKGPVSRTLALMQRRDLIAIRTDPHDGRSHIIALTAKGLCTHDAVIVTALDREQRLMACLNPSEREVLIDLLRRIHDNIGAVTAKPDS